MKQKHPLSILRRSGISGQRAKSRGTTSGSPPPRGARPHGVPSRTPALYRARPAEPTALRSRRGRVRSAARGGIPAVPLSPFHRPGALLAGKTALLVPVVALSEGSIAGKRGFVNGPAEKPRKSPRKAHPASVPSNKGKKSVKSLTQVLQIVHKHWRGFVL